MVSIILNFTTSLLIYNLAYLQTEYSIQMNSKDTVPKAFEEISWIKVDNDFLETINDCRFCSVLL